MTASMLSLLTRARPATALLVGAACAVFAVGCKSGDAKEKEGGEGHAQVAVKISTVSSGPFTETIGAIGTVAPRVGHVAALSSPQAARVAYVYVATGQHVAAGDSLVELDQTPFRAAVQSTEAALAAAESANERAQRLAAEGIVPRKDVDQAAADLARARADAANARRAAQLSIVRAPIAGVVTHMSAVLGATADVTQPLVEIADPAALDILLNLTASDAARVRSGAKVAVSAGQNAAGEQLGVGTVVDVGGAIDTTSRTVIVRVRAPTTRRPLRIGETVFGDVAVATRTAITVPAEALVPEGGGEGFKVFVVDSAGIAHERQVSVGGRNDQVAEITRGLTAGERIVTYGAYGVEDSVKVVTVPAAAKVKP